jgi:hypothetical protein
MTRDSAKTLYGRPLDGMAEQSAKNQESCHSERSEESLFVFYLNLNRREIPRFAQNDGTKHFVVAYEAATHKDDLRDNF